MAIECSGLFLKHVIPYGLTCVSKTESPESKVGSSMGHTAQAVLYCVNRLTHKYVSKIKL